MQIWKLDPANLTDNLATTTTSAAVEVVLPVAMMELASQILEVDLARIRERSLDIDVIVTNPNADNNAECLELFQIFFGKRNGVPQQSSHCFIQYLKCAEINFSVKAFSSKAPTFLKCCGM